jgi:hypothetical protein
MSGIVPLFLVLVELQQAVALVKPLTSLVPQQYREKISLT